MRRTTQFLLVLSPLLLLLPRLAQGDITLCDAAHVSVAFDGTWTQGAPMPTQRSEIGTTALDGKIYVAGGFIADGVTTAFEAYNIEHDSWETLEPIPAALHHLGLEALDGKIYLAGGFTGNFSPDNRMWVYDPAENAWTQLNDLPEPIGAHRLVNVDGTLYVVGGVPQGTALWRYDAAADTWDTSLAQMPTAREHLGATAYNGKLYVIGGRWANVGNMATVEAYDPATDTWETLPSMPTARGGFDVSTAGQWIFAGGGEDNAKGGCTFNRAEVFAPEFGLWALAPDMPIPRHGIDTVGVDGRWYIIGGATRAHGDTFRTATGQVDIFTPTAAEATETA